MSSSKLTRPNNPQQAAVSQQQQQQPKTVKKNMPAQPKKTFNRDEVSTGATATDTASQAVERINAAASQRGKTDARRILAHANQVYATTLENELRELMGGDDVSAYFQADSSGWTLPGSAAPKQFEGRTVDALPSAD